MWDNDALWFWANIVFATFGLLIFTPSSIVIATINALGAACCTYWKELDQ